MPIWRLLLLALAGVATASVPEEFARALRLSTGGETASAVEILERVVEQDPRFRRGWELLVEVREKEGRLAELERWLDASANPGACLGKLWLARVQKTNGQARFAEEGRACAVKLGEPFAAYRVWIAATPRDRWPALAAQLADAASARPDSAALKFAAGFSQAGPAAIRKWLLQIDPLRLLPADANEYDDACYLAYRPGEPELAAATLRLLERARAAGDADWVSRAYGRLSLIARDERRFAEALVYANEARQDAAALGNATYLYHFAAGESLFRLGRPAEAIPAFQAAWASGTSFRAKAVALSWLSDQYNELGRHTDAIDYSMKALEMAREQKFLDIAADQHVDLAFSWLALGQGPRALAALQEAQALLQPPAQKWHPRILNDVANVYLQLGQRQQALAAAGRSLEIAAADSLQRAEAHLLRAEGQLAAGQTPLEDLAAALALAPEIPSYLARGRLTAGRYSLAQRDYATAAQAFGEARAQGGGFPHLMVQAYTGLSDVHWRQGRLAEALAERQRALEVVESMRTSLAGEHRGGFLASRIGLYRDSTQILLRLNRTTDAFLMAERGRARALLDLREQAPSPSAPALEPLRAAQASVTRAVTPRERREAELQLQAATDRYLASLGGAGRATAALSLERIQALLPAGTALLHYTLEDAQSTLFVVRRDRVRHFTLAARRAVEAAVRPARGLLAAPPARLTTAQLREQLGRLHAMLIGPAAVELRGARELVVVADGVLQTLPFEALIEPGATGGDWATTPFLLRRYRVRYAPSASMAGAAAAIPQALLAYGGARAAPGFPALAASADEVRGIAALYPAASRRVALGAGEGDFKADPALAGAGVIHLAVHGFVDDQWPLMSGLVLPEPANADDGMLRIYEILGLRLQAGLVVLSACDSGAGREVTGEGLSSLRRAFLAAGARSIVASLWRVDDRSAARMMTAFHRHLLIRGRTPAEALQAAQQEMIQAGLAHPYYWSVFTLMTSG